MKKLPAGLKVLNSVLATIIVLLPLSVCVSLTLGDNALLKEIEHIAAAFILPSALFLAYVWLLCRIWRQ